MRIFGFVLRLLGGLALAALVAVLFGWLVQHLWNWLMPNLFHFPPIGFWQAWGLVLLSRLLFGNIGGHHKHHDHGKNGWKKLRQHRWLRCCSPHGDPANLERFDEWWEGEGEALFDGSKDCCRGGFGWWKWWKSEGKPSYERWLDGSKPAGR